MLVRFNKNKKNNQKLNKKKLIWKIFTTEKFDIL